MDKSEKVTIILVTYHSEAYIGDCIDSIKLQNYPHNIIVVDNSNNDVTKNYIENKYPEIRVISTKKNLGYGKANNIGVKYSNSKYIVFLNPDTLVAEEWLRKLIVPLKDNRSILTAPKILLHDANLINSSGNVLHFTGLSYTRGMGQNPRNYINEEYINGVSGCCFAIRKNDFIELGGFDNNIFMYNDDTDFSWRVHLNNKKIFYVPESIVFHKHTLNLTPQKLYHLERGRYLILKKYFSTKEIIKIFPSLICIEILTFIYFLTYGSIGFNYKLRAVKDGLSFNIQKYYGDTLNLMRHLSYELPVDQMISHKFEQKIIKFINIFLKYNYKVSL